MNHYHQHKHGVEAILYRKFLEKRQQSEMATTSIATAGSLQPKNIQKCNFFDGVKCLERAMPGNTKYCRKHIMEDKKQILFKMCSIEKSGVVCQEPVMNVFEDSTCVLHTSLYSTPRTYIKRKYESETDDDESFMKDVKMEDSDIKIEDIKDEEDLTVEEMDIAYDDEIKIN